MFSNTATDSKVALSLQEKLDRLLAKAMPSKRDLIQQTFRSLYPRLEAYLAQGKPLKEVLAAFNKLAESNVCQRTFREMLDKERERRDQDGNPVCCQSCNQPLQGRVVAKTSSDATSLPSLPKPE
jgi:hypothetical protein